ncbi:Peptide methionine sulfoxide reductase MsrA [Paenibacillus allorhizoplanae]|uniref:Peptide methionine sulfoxide reductase MsrA n=1 Tax=Paenibacillus allorhizoplanae TaxID=2905648 RepID=A0ABM9CFS0_9BACL|nr:peptide-methionine (S)-S-oxide reductase MsrA [Paenibacillus allorhizoplanae]CAH1210836.1 Peptide methionine sulfoxide reductase MsrA [Paenibacillus allorhizoplanae]
MRAEFAFRLLDKHINQFIHACNQCPPDKRSVIPEGYKNNVHWHLGHVLYIAQFDVLGLSNQHLVLPESYKTFFAYGTKPMDWKEEPPEWDVLIAHLKVLRNYIHDTLQDKLDEPVSENFLRAETIGELIYATTLHVSYHQGIIYGMNKTLRSHAIEAHDVLPAVNESSSTSSDTAIFAGGCFWHMEKSFRELEGVTDVYTGYTGGKDDKPTYKKVVSKTSDHLESVEIHYDPNVITYEELLQNFWKNVDPTAPGDHSAIFYTSPEQKEIVEASRKELDASKQFSKPVVTKIAAASTFYKAEDEHQNYYKRVRLAVKNTMNKYFSDPRYLEQNMWDWE